MSTPASSRSDQSDARHPFGLRDYEPRHLSFSLAGHTETTLGSKRGQTTSRGLSALVVVGIVASIAVACGAPTSAPQRGAHRVAATLPLSTTSTSPPPSTTTTSVPALSAPAHIAPLVQPALPGEGQWQPGGDRLAGGWAIYTTELRPSPGSPPVGIAWVDSAATRTVLYAGTTDPYGTWSHQGEVAPADQPRLLAAFNSGFKTAAYQTGWFADGRAAVAFQDGKASFVIFANGSATVGDWGRDVGLSANVVAVRQNLSLLVDGGSAVPEVNSPGLWGQELGGRVETWRSGVGVNQAGDLIYVGGPALDPASLARLLVAAGAVRAMELDINPEWVSFATFSHPGGLGSGAPVGTNFLSGMYYSASHYLAPFSRDFFAVFAR